MLTDLLQRVDLKKVEDSLGPLRIVKPSIISVEDENFWNFFERSRLSLIQINYYDGQEDYSIGKIYVSINALTEIALNYEYQFHAINFYRESDESVIHSYKQDGEKMAEYIIDRDVLETPSDAIYMTKSTGDEYHPAYRTSGDDRIEEIRKAWESTGRLLCYSIKHDGRKSFYLTIDQELTTGVSSTNFVDLEAPV